MRVRVRVRVKVRVEGGGWRVVRVRVEGKGERTRDARDWIEELSPAKKSEVGGGEELLLDRLPPVPCTLELPGRSRGCSSHGLGVKRGQRDGSLDCRAEG